MNRHADKPPAADSRYQAAYEDAMMRGLCEVGAREVAAGAMKRERMSATRDLDHSHVTVLASYLKDRP